MKAAHVDGSARTLPFALWRDPAGLAFVLSELLAGMPPADALAVTLTGELCDCFASKREGVAAILDAVQAVTPLPVQVWQSDGRFVSPAVARAAPLRTASANWLALATYAGRFCPTGPALLFDVGSTTSDLVPLQDGLPVPRGRTDPERLACSELVYTGIRRTPLCALLPPGRTAAELFATTLDVYLVLGQVPENGDDRDTADGRPATRAAAEARLARMICADADMLRADQIQALALTARACQVDLLRQAYRHVAEGKRFQQVVLSGSGEFLAQAVLDGLSAPPPCMRLSERLGPALSEAACAHAVAVLAAETWP